MIVVVYYGLLWYGLEWFVNGLGIRCFESANSSGGALLLFMLVYYDGDFESCRAQSIEWKKGFLFSTC